LRASTPSFEVALGGVGVAGAGLGDGVEQPPSSASEKEASAAQPETRRAHEPACKSIARRTVNGSTFGCRRWPQGRTRVGMHAD